MPRVRIAKFDAEVRGTCSKCMFPIRVGEPIQVRIVPNTSFTRSHVKCPKA